MTNEYDTLLADTPGQAAVNEYGAVIEELDRERRQRGRANVADAWNADPERTARAIKLSRETGVPIETVERDPAAAARLGAANAYDALVQDRPGLQRWLEDPVNSRVARGDYENLGSFEKIWNELRRSHLNSKAGVQALGAAIAGRQLTDLEVAKQKAARGEYLTRIETLMVAQATEAETNAQRASDSSIAKMLEYNTKAAEIPMRPALREMNDAKTWGEAWLAFAKDPLGIVFDLTVQSAPQLVGTLAVTAMTGPAGGVAFAGGQSFALEFVNGILDNLQELGVDTDDPDALRAAFTNRELMAEVYRKSTIKASIVGTLDAATMGIAGKTFVPRAVRGKLAREALNMPTQLAIQMAGGAGGEVLGSVAAGNEVKPGAAVAEAAGALGGVPGEVAAMGAKFAKPGKVPSPEQQVAEAQAAGLDRLVEAAQQTKLANRSPEKLQEFLSTVVGPDQNVLVPAEALRTYFQLLPPKEAERQADALGIAHQLPEALLRDGKIAISLAAYVTEAGKTGAHKVLREYAQLGPDGLSIREALDPQAQERVKRWIGRFEKRLEAGGPEVDAMGRVYKDLRDKLRSRGLFADEAAELYAAVYAARYQVRAERNTNLYRDAWDAYSQAGTGQGVEIISGDDKVSGSELDGGQVQAARGSITFGDDQAIIRLLKARNRSTLLHESGHLWLEEMAFDAKAAGASDRIRADWQIVLEALGSKDGTITREQHEQFARWLEAYFREGEAPTVELSRVFKEFHRWLVKIYRQLITLNAPLTPELREVFDNLIATDEQIQFREVQRELGRQGNRKGHKYEAEVRDSLRSRGLEAETNIFVQLPNGREIELDVVARDPFGNLYIYEAKSGRATVRRRQREGFEELRQLGGTVVRGAKGLFREGFKIPDGLEVIIQKEGESVQYPPSLRKPP
jgi:hypothetical protein